MFLIIFTLSILFSHSENSDYVWPAKHTNILWISHHRILHLEIFLPFLAIFGQKNQSFLLIMKFVTYSNLGILNSMVTFTFSVLDQKYPFWANLVQKYKIVCLSWNLVPRLIRTSKFEYSRFLFHTQSK